MNPEDLENFESYWIASCAVSSFDDTLLVKIIGLQRTENLYKGSPFIINNEPRCGEPFFMILMNVEK